MTTQLILLLWNGTICTTITKAGATLQEQHHFYTDSTTTNIIITILQNTAFSVTNTKEGISPLHLE